MQTQHLETKPEQEQDAFGTQSVTPPVGTQGQPDLATGLPGMLGVDCQPSEPDHLTGGHNSEGVLAPRILLRRFDHAGQRRGHLLSGARLE